MGTPDRGFPAKLVRQLVTALATALTPALLLAACGTAEPNDPRPNPAALSITSIIPDAAAAGQTVVISGAGFGTAGSVRVGEAQALTVTWADERIEFVVPAAAEPAWQTLQVSPAATSELAHTQFFVGTTFTGEPETFQEFLDRQPPGGHVLLPAGELRLAGQSITLAGLHLYGAEDGTSLELGTGGLEIVVGVAQAASLNHLRLAANHVRQRSALPGAHVRSEGWVTTLVGLNRVQLHVSEFGHDDSDPNALVAGALTLNDSTVTAEGSATLVGHPALAITDSAISAERVAAQAALGSVAIDTASVTASMHVRVFGMYDVDVIDSTLQAATGLIELTVAQDGDIGELPGTPGRLRVTGSALVTLYDNGISMFGGDIKLRVRYGALELVDNERIRARAGLNLSVDYGTSVTITGNQEISAGRLPQGVDDNGKIRFEFWRLYHGSVLIAGNTFLATSQLNVADTSEPDWPAALELPPELLDQAFRFTGNTIDMTQGTNASLRVQANGVNTPLCEFSGNHAELVASDGDAFASIGCEAEEGTVATFKVNDNHLRLAGTWPYDDLLVSYRGGGQQSEFLANEVEVAGSLEFVSHDHLTIAGNQLHVGRVTLSPRHPSAQTYFQENTVTADQVIDAALQVFSRAYLEITDNQFTQLGVTAPNTLALHVTAEDSSVLNAQENSFTNLGRAIKISADGVRLDGTLNANRFDFPLEAAPDAADIVASNAAEVVLDLRGNRWGQVQTPSQLDDLISVSFDADSLVSLDISTVLTE